MEMNAMPSLLSADPFSVWEFYAFKVALFIIFISALYRLVRREVRK
jgi:hypothetical protein